MSLVLQPRRGLTIVDLVVSLCVILMLGSTVLTTTCRSRETADRVKCASNLRTIGQAILLYANENRFVYPMATYDPDTAHAPVAFTGAFAKNLADPDAPLPNDVTAALFLLVRTQEITPEFFTCPTSSAERWDYSRPDDSESRKPTAFDRSNWPSDRFLSYAYVTPYPGREAVAKGYRLNTSISAEFAVASDLGPKGDAPLKVRVNSPRSDMSTANSLNHDRDGQNVLYGDGRVEFQSNVFVGFSQDNIFTAGDPAASPGPLSASLIGTPASAGDSILLPHASYDTLPWNPYKNRPMLRWLAGVYDNWPKVLAAVVLLGVGLWMARVLLAKD